MWRLIAELLGFVFAAWWEGVDWGDWAPTAELGRLLWHERDTLLQELIGLPPGQVDLDGFARRFRALIGHHRRHVRPRAPGLPGRRHPELTTASRQAARTVAVSRG